MRRVVVALICFSASAAAAACAAVLGVDDVGYSGASDGAADGGAQNVDGSTRDASDGGGGEADSDATDAPDATPVPRPTIACQSGACIAATQECCLNWAQGAGAGPDTCVDGHGQCTLDGSTETSYVECDDSTDCATWAQSATVCCLTTGDPIGLRFTSRCVQQGTCVGASKLVLCDPSLPNICPGDAGCLEFNNTYIACQ